MNRTIKLVQDETGLIFPVNEIIVGLAGGSTADDAASIARSVNRSIVGYVPSTQSYQLRLQTTSIPELDLVAATLKSDGRVVEVLRNYAASLFGTTTDLKNLQGCLPTAAAAYDRVLLQNAWDIIPLSRVTTSQLLIGVLDTGTNRAHQEFNNPFVDTGPESPSSPSDTSADGHGTAIAGIIGANNVPETLGTCTAPNAFQMTGFVAGVSGLNYGLRIRANKYPIEFITNEIFNFAFSLSAFLDALASEGVHTINLSWGVSSIWQSYFARQMSAHPDILFVIAAGNDDIDANNVSPANVKLPNTLTVGATDLFDKRALFSEPGLTASNFGTSVDMAAPAIGVWGPALGQTTYILGDGTSFSAPMITGAAGILQSLGVGSPASLKFYLTASGDPIPTTDNKPIGGRRLNVFCAVQLVLPPSQTLNDDFSEGFQQLGMTQVSSGIGYMGLASRCKVSGDFDVQVDYHLLNWPAQNFHTVRLMASDLPDGGTGFPGVYRNIMPTRTTNSGTNLARRDSCRYPPPTPRERSA